MHPDIEKLIQLQALETRIGHFAAKIERFPQQMAAMEERLRGTKSLMDRQEKTLRQIGTDRRRLEGEVQIIEEKVSKYRSQLSEVKTNDQYKALLHEIDFHTERIHKMEDEILISMEKEEGLRAERLLLEQQFRRESARLDQERQVARQDVEVARIHLAQREEECRALIALITPEVYETYRKIAGVRKGVALARATENCQGCHVRIRPSVLGQVMGGRQIVNCDRCDRFLYWQPDAPYEVSSRSGGETR